MDDLKDGQYDNIGHRADSFARVFRGLPSVQLQLANTALRSISERMSTAVIEPPPSDKDTVEDKETPNLAGKKKPWTRLIPFTRSWHEHRKAGSSPAITRIEPAKEAEVATPQQTVPIQAPATNTATQTTLVTAVEASTVTTTKTIVKPLAQYPHHDNKGAVGWVAPTTSADRPYPHRQYVQGQRVLAQYGHHDNKWAVKHPVY